jgi:enoyl-CoA hydratase/carnithine racemase
MVESDVLRYEVRDQKAFITFNRPRVMNAYNKEVVRLLGEAAEAAENDDDVRVIILSGEGGRAFSAGADLKEMADRGASTDGLITGNPLKDMHYFGEAGSGISILANVTKPVIAAIDGYALAGGLQIAIVCDIRIATRQSVFALPEPRHSIIAGPGLIHLSRMIPLGEALHMQLTGSAISAERAYQVGLISGLYDTREELFAEANRIAEEIIACAPLAVAFIKRVVRRGRDLTVQAQESYSEMFQAAIVTSEDFQEGPRAFAERRAPQWKGR